MKEYEITLTLTEELLGTVPKDPEVYARHIANRAALDDEQLAEELNTVAEMEEKGWTGFHMLDGKPILYNYVIKGFFKDACGMLRRANGTKSAALPAYKKVIDGLLFIFPRQIPVHPNGQMGVNERPLRASTAQGERIALARSDTCPPGSTITFQLHVMGVVTDVLLREWLDYGELRGLGQWRNAGYGSFTYELENLSQGDAVRCMA